MLLLWKHVDECLKLEDSFESQAATRARLLFESFEFPLLQFHLFHKSADGREGRLAAEERESARRNEVVLLIFVETCL